MVLLYLLTSLLLGRVGAEWEAEADSYGVAFQRNGVIDDNSLNVWGIGPGFSTGASTFSVCAWVFIYYVRKPNPVWSYCLPRAGKAPLCSSFGDSPPC